MKLVLDTNVILEMLHWGDPRCAELLAALESGGASCCTDADCLAELERVLAYPQFGLVPAARDALFARYAALAARVDDDTAGAAATAAPLPRCRDADDQKFMTLAARAGAALLVTRDKELLRLARSRRTPPPFAILTPEAARLRLAAASATATPPETAA